MIKLAATAQKLRWPVVIASILAVATLLRFIRIGDVPLPLSDEVFASVDIHSILLTGHHFDGSPAGVLAYIVLAIDGRLIAFLIHGATLVDLRTVSAAFGLATVAVLIPLGTELGDFRLGVLAAAVLAVMPWSIYFSRIFYPASEYAFLTTLALVLALRALRTKSNVSALGSAIAAVASVYIYPVAIVATPLLVGCIVATRTRQAMRFGLFKLLVVSMVACLLLVPYLIAHLAVTDANVATQNTVITDKMIWNHGLSMSGMLSQFWRTWLSFLTVQFTILHGDPNVRWSIQVIGSVGWITGLVGWIGVVVAIARRNSTDRLLLLWLALYPVGDAITYYDATPNSVRGITGAVVWSFFVATAIRRLGQVATKRRLRASRHRRNVLRVSVMVAVGVAMAVQVLAFASVYFGSYDSQYAYAFETGYPEIYSVLKEKGLDSVPITLHAGYQRDLMLQYFSQYRLHASDQLLACYDLPFDVLHFTVLPRIFIVREDPDVQSMPGCIHQGLIQRDEAALLSVASPPGKPARRLDVISVFPDDVSGRFMTAILYVHY